MEYTEEFLKNIVQVGKLGYPLSKIINVLDIEDVETFTKDFYDPNSQVAINYRKGVDKSDFMIDLKLFNMAANGDLKALEKYEKRKLTHIYNNEVERKRNKQ